MVFAMIIMELFTPKAYDVTLHDESDVWLEYSELFSNLKT